MNDFIENIGKTVNKTTKKALKVSGDMIELTKTSVNIKFDEAKKENFYKEIGKLVYTKYTENPQSIEEDIANLCKCIEEIDSAIAHQKSQVAKIKRQKFCVACGQKLDLTIVYCFACGAKQPELPKEEENCDCCCENNDDDVCCCNDETCCSEESCECECDCEESKADNCCDDEKCDCDKAE